MYQIYGNLSFLRNFFRNYFRCFFVFPVFTGVSEHKKRATEAAPFPNYHDADYVSCVAFANAPA
jgi:hypothetical protein